MMKEKYLFEWNPWWHETFEADFVQRDVMGQITPWLDRDEIVSITGVRRSGKTTLLYMLINHLLEEEQPESLLFVKCDDERVEGDVINEALALHEELYDTERRYLFLDEVQYVPTWSETLKRLYDLHEDIKIFLTGSRLLQQELGAKLAGRTASFEVYPFSFLEFLRSRDVPVQDVPANTDTFRRLLREYMECGGFPEVTMADSGLRAELLSFYSNTILYRDVVERSDIAKVDKVERLKTYLLANIANPLNYKKIADHLGIATDTITRYVQAMEDAYYFFPLKHFAYSVKKQQVNPKKIYCVDNGLRNAVGFRFSTDKGRLYENLVFLSLKRTSKELYYWKDGKNRETDFITRSGDSTERAIQVCYDPEAAGGREEDALLSALNHFNLDEGLVVTHDEERVEERDGKRVSYVPLWKWLLRDA